MIIFGRAPILLNFLTILAHDFDPHVLRGAHDDLFRGVEVVGVQIGKLAFGNRANLRFRYLADFALKRIRSALSIPAAALSNADAGGVLRMKLNVRSSKIVISAGTTTPFMSFVASLNCLQKS